MARALAFAAAIATFVPWAARAAGDNTAKELYSPDHHHSVRLLETALPGSDPDDGFFTIAVRSGDHYIAKYPTMGFLIDAFWSPDRKYVAVDNRRANSGDYLWVFRLADGRAIRMPIDAIPGHADDAYEKYAEELVRHVSKQFPQLTFREFRKLFTFAKGWTESGDLIVKTNFAFTNLPDDQIAILLQTFRITDDKLVLVNEKAEKAPWPPKT